MSEERTTATERGRRKVRTGVVVSDKMDKTRVVRVVRSVRHPFYEKVMKKSKKFHAHDEEETFKVGDLVFIEESRPISKNKRWVVVAAAAGGK